MNSIQRYKQNLLLRKGIVKGVDKASGKDASATVIVNGLEQDLADLKAIASIKDKIEHKQKTLLPKYLKVADDYIQSGGKDPCDALVYCMIWSFDTGNIDAAFQLLADCIETEQQMPEHFKSSMPAFAYSAFLDWANEQYTQGHSVEPYFGDAYATVETGQYQLPDALVANYHKLKGHLHFDANELEAAVTAYQKVVDLLGESKSGVKTKLGQALKQLEDSSAQADKE